MVNQSYPIINNSYVYNSYIIRGSYYKVLSNIVFV